MTYKPLCEGVLRHYFRLSQLRYTRNFHQSLRFYWLKETLWVFSPSSFSKQLSLSHKPHHIAKLHGLLFQGRVVSLHCTAGDSSISLWLMGAG